MINQFTPNLHQHVSANPRSAVESYSSSSSRKTPSHHPSSDRQKEKFSQNLDHAEKKHTTHTSSANESSDSRTDDLSQHTEEVQKEDPTSDGLRVDIAQAKAAENQENTQATQFHLTQLLTPIETDQMIPAHQGKGGVSLEEQMMLHSQKENGLLQDQVSMGSGLLRDQVSMEASLQLAKAQLATEGEEDPSMLTQSQNFSDEMQTVKPDTILKQTMKEEKMIMKQAEQIGLTLKSTPIQLQQEGMQNQNLRESLEAISNQNMTEEGLQPTQNPEMISHFIGAKGTLNKIEKNHQEELLTPSPQNASFDLFANSLSNENTKQNTQPVSAENFVNELQNLSSTSSADDAFDVSQIIRNSKFNRNDTSQELTMQLTPEHLGKLTMKMQQEGDRLMVEMRVDNYNAKQMIEANMADIRNRFLEQDFSFEEITVEVNVDQQQFSDFAEGNQGEFEEEYTSRQQEERLEEKVLESVKIRQPLGAGGLNLYA